MIDKASDAFRTISEAADELGLQQHVLRFWETRFSQIKPLKRGGGRRYYRPDDMDFLRGLKHLLHGERYTIKGVQKIIKEQGIKAVQNVWRDESALSIAAPPAPQPEAAVASAPRAHAGAPKQNAVPPRESAAKAAPVPLEPRGGGTALERALNELLECRRIVEAARAA